MVHSTRFNYKAKSQIVDDLGDKQDDARDKIGNLIQHARVHIKASNEIAHQAEILASMTTYCSEFLDAHLVIGGTRFEKTACEADPKLPTLPVCTVLKRTHQVMSLMGQRLEIAVDEIRKLEETFHDLYKEVQLNDTATKELQSSILAIREIGPRPSSAEIKQLTKSAEDDVPFYRHGVSIDYESDSDDEYEANGIAAT